MPIITVGVKRLSSFLGRSFPMNRLAEALEELGCDVEDTVEVVHYGCPACGMVTEQLPHAAPPRRCEYCAIEQDQPLAEKARLEAIRLDLLADRPDLFDIGGLTRALKGFLGLTAGLPGYAAQPGEVVVEIDARLSRPETYRPFIFCAEVEVPPMTSEDLVDLMHFQESLHWGIGRDRKLASIGVYDLDAIVPPIRYTLLDPDGARFAPLGMGSTPMAGREILQSHPKGRAYAHLLAGHTAYPLLVDARGQVLSMPPIINSEQSRVKIGSRRLFVDVTGVVEDATRNSLYTLVSSLAELGGTIRTVRLEGPAGACQVEPELAPRTTEIVLDEARSWLGLPLSDEQIRELFGRMRLDAAIAEGRAQVTYPRLRSDIRHPVDLFADLAIGVGYANVPKRLVASSTVSRERPEEAISAVARQAMLGLGYWEIVSLVQTNERDHFAAFRIPVGEEHVLIENPKTVETTMVRTHLMTGLLDTLSRNRRRALPQRFFEIGNVVHAGGDSDTHTREQRRLAFVVCGPDAGFAAVRSVADAVCRELGCEAAYRADSHPSFSAGRCAAFAAAGSGGRSVAGRIGEIHPEVLVSFSLQHPVALGEVELCPLP